MADSVGYAILEAVQVILRAVPLLEVLAAEIKIRELPKVGETLDHLPSVLICPHQKIGMMPLGFEGSAGYSHGVEICIVDANEADNQTDQEKRQAWHEQVIEAIELENTGADGIQFRCGLVHVPEVWGIEIQEAPTFDRSKLSKLYSYQSVVVNFLTTRR